jgi:hypothetical protein
MFTISVQTLEVDGNGFSILQIMYSLGYYSTEDNKYILGATDECTACIWFSGW